MKETQSEKDYLWLNIRELPYFRGLLRAVEARFYQDIELPSPILDVGCGDGQFATIAFDSPIDVGIDPWWEPLKEAKNRNFYKLLLQADGGKMPFPDNTFGSAVSNSVLEHIPHLDAVIQEIGRVLKPGAPFVFAVPNHNFTKSLSIGNFFDKMHLHSLSTTYRTWFNHIARHQHLDSPEIWEQRLEKAGLHIEKYWHYYDPSALAVTEWGHFFGLPSLFTKKLFGRWILIPNHTNLFFTERLTRPHYEKNPKCEDGTCTFYITRRNNQ